MYRRWSPDITPLLEHNNPMCCDQPYHGSQSAVYSSGSDALSKDEAPVKVGCDNNARTAGMSLGPCECMIQEKAK